MTGARPLRVLLVANDGFSAGHVARSVAIACALDRVAVRRGLALRMVLATTSQAHALMAAVPAAIVRMPGPVAARRGGLADLERRALVRGVVDGVVDSLRPDLLVVDTFPSGPHGELAGLRGPGAMKRALVRRATADLRPATVPVPAELRDVLTSGLADYDLAVLAGDPTPLAVELPIAMAHVPPILMDAGAGGAGDVGGDGDAGGAGDGARGGRAALRARLGLGAGRVILVAAGGGGDGDAVARAMAICEAIVRVAPDATAVLALGPLAPDAIASSGARDAGAEATVNVGAEAMRDAMADATRDAMAHASPSSAVDRSPALHPRIRTLRIAPLAPVLAAFDGAFS
ncbi:MAG TPA: hypothetical protein VH165_31550, partial [Kofleriaceae bacterium]|nr:hypothetical protein [Kofleriaceae bacterium]